jgi:hypothetical protein
VWSDGKTVPSRRLARLILEKELDSLHPEVASMVSTGKIELSRGIGFQPVILRGDRLKTCPSGCSNFGTG